MPDQSRPLGILAGGGGLPREIAEVVTARGREVFLVGIAGEGEPSFAPFPHVVRSWGSIGGILSAFRSAGVRELVIVGGVRRPDLLRLRPDLGFLRALPTILRLVRAGGDDGVLRGVIGFFEANGFEVVSPAAVAPEILAGEGSLGRIAPRPPDLADVEVGREIVSRLGPYDIGQAVVVAGGRVVAIEGAEGTDAMLRRVARVRGAAAVMNPRAGVLVKRPKPGQDLRIDLPAVGPGTVCAADRAQLSGIAVDAGAVIVARRGELVAAADAAGLFVTGSRDDRTSSAGRTDRLRWSADSAGRPSALHVLVGRRRAVSLADAAKGVAVIETLSPFEVGRAVVVARGHVLAVEAGEGPHAAIARAGELRQWGARRRLGVAVLSRAADADARAVAAAGNAGLAAIVLAPGAAACEVPASTREAAARCRVAIAALAPIEGRPR